MSAQAGGPPPRLDSVGMWRAAASLPQCLRDGLHAARDAFGTHTWDLGAVDPVRTVAVFGTGTGGLAAGATVALAEPHLGLACWVGAGGEGGVPAFVGPDTLVLGVSCGDGATGTTWSVRESMARGARCAVVSDEGPLVELAAEHGLAHCAPATAGGPVAGLGAFGAAVVSLLVALARVGLAGDVASSVHAAADALGRRADALGGTGGEAEALARRIGRTIPIIYGAGPVGGPASRWWKARVNRNAKAPAFAAQLPALVHDELAGWGQDGDVTRQVMTLVLLRDAAEPAETDALFDAVATATDEVMSDVVEVRAEGADELGRLLDLALVGELVSLHLAAREGVDPGPLPAVDDARARLERS